MNADHPKVFISYSWDNEPHMSWVRKLATRLRQDGVEAMIDKWGVIPGGRLPEFMERSVRENDFVLIICTPKYKEKSDRRLGGVGYEGDIMTAEVLAYGRDEKFIPILRSGEWKVAAPSWLLGKAYVDLRGEPYDVEAYKELLDALWGRQDLPTVTVLPRNSGKSHEKVEYHAVRSKYLQHLLSID